MARICLIIEYDGRNYGGWQVQPNAVTIQALIEDALEHVVGYAVRLYSSGRTDAGVHARGMVAHFDVEEALPLAAYRDGVNRFLPADIAIQHAEIVSDHFNARFDACGKWYQYQVYRSAVRSPLHERMAWRVAQELNLDDMRQAADALVGRHDFAAFRSSSCCSATTVREIYSLALIEEGAMLRIDVRGSGFLKNMVRIMVGTLISVGQGRIQPQEIGSLLNGGQRQQAGSTAPPHGLCLMTVWYKKSV